MSSPDNEPQGSGCFESVFSFGVFGVSAVAGIYMFVGTLAWASIPETTITSEQLITGIGFGALAFTFALYTFQDWYNNGS